MKSKLLLLFLLFSSTLINSQVNKNSLESYIPSNTITFEKYPLKTIKLNFHVVSFSEDNPKNIIPKDSAKLYYLVDRLNYIYSNLTYPTLVSQSNPKTIFDSRVRFTLNNIFWHTDSLLWNTDILVEGGMSGTPWKIDSVDLENNQIIFKGRFNQYFVKKPKGMDSLVVYNKNSTKSFLHFDTLYYDSENRKTVIKIKESLIKYNGEIEKIVNLKVKTKVCDDDAFLKLSNDSTALNVFLLGNMLKTIGGGCGPSPVYLNIQNTYGNDIPLYAHEIGHCLGLAHTDYPQFKDLPKSDEFCNCDCDSVKTSNNIMGYNFCRNYLSPLQIAHIQKEYNNNVIKIKTSTDAYYTEGRVLRFTNDSIFRNISFGGDIIIRKRKTTVLSSNLYLPEGALVYVEKRAKLVIDGGKITNIVGSEWEGVFYVKKYKSDKNRLKYIKNNSAYLELKNGGSIEKAKQK